MSYVLEGIIVPDGKSAAADRIADSETELDVIPLGEKLSILARPGRRPFDDAVCEWAGGLSSAMGVTLLVRWDDRVGFRESRVFRDGIETHQFTHEHELYVMLDDDGMPIRHGRKYKPSELDAFGDQEFEVFQNAIELGCEESGFCPWRILYTFIQHNG